MLTPSDFNSDGIRGTWNVVGPSGTEIGDDFKLDGWPISISIGATSGVTVLNIPRSLGAL